MLDQGSEIPLRDLHLSQDLRKLHWKRSKTVSMGMERRWTKGTRNWREYDQNHKIRREISPAATIQPRKWYMTWKNDKWTSENKMLIDTNQKDARGAALRTGRRVEVAGHSGGSYQESASNLGPGWESKETLRFHVCTILKHHKQLSTQHLKAMINVQYVSTDWSM